MSRVIHFDIPAEDPTRAMKFYGTVFGWEFNRFGEEEYWLCKTGPSEQPGIDGGIMRRNDPQQPVTTTIQVASVDETSARIAREGGAVVVPKMPIPGVGHLAFFKDPEGNILGVCELDATVQ